MKQAKQKILSLAVAMAVAMAVALPALAATDDERIQMLEKQLAEQQRMLDAIREELQRLKGTTTGLWITCFALGGISAKNSTERS